MKGLIALLIFPLLFFSLNAQIYQPSKSHSDKQEWVKVRFDPGSLHLQVLVKGGIIEAESNDASQGWMLASYYVMYANYFDLQKLDSEIREIRPLDIPLSPDTLGQVVRWMWC